jgi:competence CoiA-like predicted nuclease
MKKAFDTFGNLVSANLANRQNGSYTCPCCGQGVFKAGGRKQTDHFRHNVGGSKTWCDLYVQGLGSGYDPYDYSTLLNVPYITFDETELDWELNLSFPKIARSFTRLFEDMNLYFNITCPQAKEKKLQSIHLRHDSSTNKLRITPKKYYQVLVDKRDNANRLNLKWPEVINGFKRDTYLFSYVNGEFVMMVRENISLQETFYIISKKYISSFHKKLNVQPLKNKYNWYAYKIELPETLDDSLVNWFYRNFNYTLDPPYYYIDLIAPSVYGRHEQAYSINSQKCTIAVSFRLFSHVNPTAVHINSDMSSQEFQLKTGTRQFDALSLGYHTFYIKGFEGKKLTLYVTKNIYQKTIYQNGYNIGSQKLLVFNDTEVSVDYNNIVSHNIPFDIWIKRKGKFPYLLKEDQQISIEKDTVFYSPNVWSLSVKIRKEVQALPYDVSFLLNLYIRMGFTKFSFINKKQYKYLVSFVQQFPNGNQKQNLNYLIKLYRNKVPIQIKEMLNDI